MIRIREADRRCRLWFLRKVSMLGRRMRRRGSTLTWWADEQIHELVTGRAVRR